MRTLTLPAADWRKLVTGVTPTAKVCIEIKTPTVLCSDRNLTDLKQELVL